LSLLLLVELVETVDIDWSRRGWFGTPFWLSSRLLVELVETVDIDWSRRGWFGTPF